MMVDRDLELLKYADPAAEARDAQGAPEQLAAILATERTTPRRRLGVRPRRLIAAAGVGAVALATVVALLPGGADKASPGAARALSSVASVAAAQAAIPNAGYAYHKLVREDIATADPAGGYSWIVPTTIEQWVAPDGSGRVRETPGEPEFVGPRDEQRWRESGADPLGQGKATDERFAPGELDNTTPGAENLEPTRDLPTDTAQLSAVIRAAARKSTDVPVEPKMFEIASALLMQAGATPQLRAALYEVVAEIDGVKLDGDVRDPRGRPGIAVSIDYDYSGAKTRDTLVFDSETSQPLAQYSRLLERLPTRDGFDNGATTVEQAGNTPALTDRP
jgi:hypothetical protein